VISTDGVPEGCAHNECIAAKRRPHSPGETSGSNAPGRGLEAGAYRQVSVLAAGIVIAIGTLVLLGWAADSTLLKSVVAGLTPMKANTALAFVVSGAALICLRESASERSKVTGRVLGLVVGLFGLLVAVEYVFGGFGLDQLLFTDTASEVPGRPSPHTAGALVIFGLAVAGTDLPSRWGRSTPYLAGAFAVAVLFAVVGYAFGVHYLHSGGGVSGIAVHTLLVLVLLAVSLFCLRPERGLVGTMLGDDAGAQMARTWLPVAILAPLLVGMARLGAQKSGLVGLRVGVSINTLAAVLGLTALVLVTARRLRRADAGLRRLAAIVETSADAIMSIGRRREITSWNPGAERLFGYTREEAIGRPVVDLVPPRRLREFERGMDGIWGGTPVVGWETERQRKDGSPVEVELTVSPLRDSRGRPAGASAILRDISERRESQRRFESLLEATPDPIVIVGEDGKIVLVNKRVEQALGYSREELLGRSVELLVPEHLWNAHTKHRAKFMRHPEARHMGGGVELSARRRDGSEFPAEVSLSPLRTQEGMLVIAAVRDVTERKEAARALAESEERFRRSFEHSAIGMVLVDLEDGRPGRVLAANGAFVATSGYSADQLRELTPTALANPIELPEALAELEDLLARKIEFTRREMRLIAAGGEQIWASITSSVVHEPDGTPAYLIVQVQDISERKHFEGQLQYLADHDALTGLFNRRRFEEELERELATAQRFETGGAVLVLDLDHFKLVNDTLGHSAGDGLISTVSEILRKRLRSSDVLGRMGGDEFAVVLPQVGREEACRVGELLLEEIREDAGISGTSGRKRVTASIGISLFDGGTGGASAQELLSEADIAMYDAKEAGRDRLTVFDPGSPRHERTQMRLDWLQRIELALENDLFVLQAQPILSLDGDRRGRFELLLRMIGDDGDLIPPGAFLHLAERSELAQRIDRWVITRAAEMLAEQERRGRDVCFEVNLSGGSIGDEAIGDHIAATLRRTGIDPGRLVFEVTETAAIVNVGRAKEFAERMHELGCGFALDDFGAGFASFYYLKHLSFDYLKIDGEFIRNLPASRTDQLVVRSVVEIARGLGKRTIAECVGDRRTIELLRAYGVDFAQGFYVGVPAPLEAGDRVDTDLSNTFPG
jgi:diguanylate cyclase (GGDEF)-like protein/PAS domain S-box-containing protein